MAIDSDRSVYVVLAAAADQATGAQRPHQIVAIQEGREAAEQLERRYAEAADDVAHVATRVFTQRYTLPYVAPAVKDLVGQGSSRNT